MFDKLIGGDKKSWDDFVRRYSPVVYSAVFRTLSHYTGTAKETDAEDLAQEVFLSLVGEDFKRLKSYDPRRAGIVTWLTVIARSLTIDELRKRRIETSTLTSEDTPAPIHENKEHPAIPAGLLTARQELILHLFFDREQTVAQIALTLGITEQSVRSLRHKAIERLRSHFKKDKKSGDV